MPRVSLDYDHEAEYRRFLPTLERICRFGLLGKKIAILGGENFIRRGPNILIGNHIGSYKDVATLFLTAGRPIFFNANAQIFNHTEFSALVRKHLKRHMGRVGLLLDFLLNPYKFLFVDYIAANISRIGSIPVYLLSGKLEAVERCEDYMRRGRAVVSLQGRGRVDPRAPNPYIWPFGRGAAFVAYDLMEREGLDVPVTPLALFGTHVAWPIPFTIRLNVGAPMHVRDFLGGGRDASILRFKAAMEDRVLALFKDILRRR
jgi:1-acyl-sn-glycerol-3-phosphate acyltransferase